MKEKIEEIKVLRQHLDGILTLSECVLSVKPAVYGDNISSFPYFELVCYKQSLMMGRAWLGKALGALGEETPYKNDGKRETKADIEPATDLCSPKEFDPVEFAQHTYVYQIDKLREMIKIVVEDLGNPIADFRNKYYNYALCMQRSNQHLEEARMWLGYALGVLRDQK